MTEHFIDKAIKKPGQLHRDLNIEQGKKIPPRMLKRAEHSSNPKIAQRARFAETLKSFHHRGAGRSR